MDDGGIKFECRWSRGPAAIPRALLREIRLWRGRLRRLGLIGVTSQGVGFGNVSHRRLEGGFYITASATGGVRRFGARHCAVVEEWSLADNWLACRGRARASSESLSHAAIYAANADAGAVVHVHSRVLWDRELGRLPTTDGGIEYGTPEMALALAALAAAPAGPRVVVMGGHPDGLIAWGQDMRGAAGALIALIKGEG